MDELRLVSLASLSEARRWPVADTEGSSLLLLLEDLQLLTKRCRSCRGHRCSFLLLDSCLLRQEKYIQYYYSGVVQYNTQLMGIAVVSVSFLLFM